ncbi:divalent metal ion transporter [Aulographum hederae CBS 113979]|uniref:Divalent metal ion transporter n=1 Tax=Aulographum hederae CBS 113979 TaxID=1176131 RepID=A0A6G1GTG9_9PEZI|nr:divalent metal ion transporter [Aulographum hederae CBS 113979]
MNCPSRTDPEILLQEGWNQNPDQFAADLTTRNDLNGRVNSRYLKDHKLRPEETAPDEIIACNSTNEPARLPATKTAKSGGEDEEDQKASSEKDKKSLGDKMRALHINLHRRGKNAGTKAKPLTSAVENNEKRESEKNNSNVETGAVTGANAGGSPGSESDPPGPFRKVAKTIMHVMAKYAKFIGPGFMVSVAYIDPGNYATDVAAGATYRFRLLFVILLSNIFAIFLQSLCVKLGTVTGMNLAENCKANLPMWLNYVLYVFAEAAIIATDIAEVIGTAIALNVLLKVPLVAGCAISIVDVLIILLFYRPSGSMRGLRAFEFFVMLLVLGVVICFCYQLSLLKDTSVGEVFRGYLPSSAVIESKGLYQSCGILGATVMPHSLYLGSGVVQARLKEFDDAMKPTPLANPVNSRNSSDDSLHQTRTEDSAKPPPYRPSIFAIRACLSYSVVELAISLFTFALFVNSAILIVAGASLSNGGVADEAASADLFGIHDLLSSTIAPVAGTIFALALLLSGTSAGIVCTIAGQMVSEGQLNWTIKPWMRRLITRTISITPSIIIAGAVGKDGLSAALEGSQVALSVILPFVSAPLIYFTCRNKFMTVVTHEDVVTAPAEGGGAAADGEEQATREVQGVKMRNHWVTMVFAGLIWGVIVVMNIALLVLVGLGVE